MYNRKKKHGTNDIKPHYKRDDNEQAGSSPSRSESAASSQDSRNHSPKESQQRDSQSGEPRKKEFNPNRKKKPYYSKDKNRKPNPGQPEKSVQASGEQSSTDKPQGEPKKKSGYWQNRRRKNGPNRNKNPQSNQNNQNSQNSQNNQPNRNKNTYKDTRKAPLNHPVILPEEIQTMEPLPDSILEFKPAGVIDDMNIEETPAVDEIEETVDEMEAAAAAHNQDSINKMVNPEDRVSHDYKSEDSGKKEESENTSKLDIKKKPVIKERGADSGAICPICDSPIRHLNTAIWHKEEGVPAHFDCIVKELVTENKERLGKNKRIYYIGAGKFAIVKEQFDKRGRLKGYQVLERIEYEHAES